METSHNYTIEEINKLREEKREELRQSKEQLQQLGQQLFAPHESKGKLDSLMRNINMGIAAYDGVMTGVKVLRRIRGYFNDRK